MSRTIPTRPAALAGLFLLPALVLGSCAHAPGGETGSPSAAAGAGTAPGAGAGAAGPAGVAGAAGVGGEAGVPERAVRRTIPMLDNIRNAFASETRDSTGAPGPKYWQLWTEYTIRARLEPSTRTVTGSERVVIDNPSDSTLTTIVLRLDQNLFRANVPREEAVPEITGGMTLTKLVLNGQAVDLADTTRPNVTPSGRRYGTPIAEAIKETVVQIPLPSPIVAHGQGTMEAEWSFQVPRAFNGRGERMGAWADTLFQVAQWYPQVAVFDDLRGWDTEPYLGPAEFYNNFGRFDVTIDVPAGWLVASTGVLQNADEVLAPAVRERLSGVVASDELRHIVAADQQGAGTATASGHRLVWHFVADSVADVAWATSNRYVWDATGVDIPGGGRIPLNIFYLPGHAQRFARAPEVVRHALQFYSRLWMPYAFPVMTMVDGPEMGMEYPMFIMSGVGAADHETGHEWWPMMVGTNETWYGFMDEGFNQYMNILSDADAEGKRPQLDGLGQAYGKVSGQELEPPLMWPSNYAGPFYSFQAYGKAPLMLSSLGGVVGDTAVWRAMREYARAWAFKHPSPWDYAFYMSNALGRDLGWFWYYWLFSTDAVDGSIQSVTTAAGRTTITIRQDGQMPSPVVLGVELTGAEPAVRAPANAVRVGTNTYELRWPVDIWFSGSRTFRAVLDFGGRGVARVILDPYGRFPDADPSDNVWPRE